MIQWQLCENHIGIYTHWSVCKYSYFRWFLCL